MNMRALGGVTEWLKDIAGIIFLVCFIGGACAALSAAAVLLHRAQQIDAGQR